MSLMKSILKPMEHGVNFFDKTHIIPDDKSEWLDIILDRANSMYERDKKPSFDYYLVIRK